MKKQPDESNYVVMGTMSRSDSKFYAKKNKVDMARLLSAIHVFHEVSHEEYGIQDHPHIILHADGSGSVVSLRKTFYSKKEADGQLFLFHNLKELVKEADRLMEKHNIIWRD